VSDTIEFSYIPIVWLFCMGKSSFTFLQFSRDSGTLVAFDGYFSERIVLLYWHQSHLQCTIYLFPTTAIFTDPGAVPRTATPLADDSKENKYRALNASEGASNTLPFKKYCKRCKAYKPIRAHHCSICARCIVKMDHHCPLVLFYLVYTCLY
jgi:hypothetical protein